MVGYNIWYFKNLKENVDIFYNRLSVDILTKFRFTIMKYFYFEYPVVDFLLTTKREKNYIGETYINYPEYIGIFFWITAGLSFDF